jgi:hypothetical protein
MQEYNASFSADETGFAGGFEHIQAGCLFGNVNNEFARETITFDKIISICLSQRLLIYSLVL